MNLFEVWKYFRFVYISVIQGRDDLRQDAVMQQVFGMVNSLLQKDQETRKRHLKVRTYKVRQPTNLKPCITNHGEIKFSLNVLGTIIKVRQSSNFFRKT